MIVDPPAAISSTILIVDDSTRYRTQMRHMIDKTCPWVLVYEAETTAGALRLVADIQPQLVFADIVLGDESGIDCARQIKVLAPATPIVLISAYPDHEFRRAGRDAGVVAFYDKKDLNAATMRDIITALLGRNP
jgi:DNA-binding NarL/FixJ family response regulator